MRLNPFDLLSPPSTMLMLVGFVALSGTSPLMAKGLQKLSEKNPSEEAAADTESTEDTEKTGSKAEKAPTQEKADAAAKTEVVASATSKELSQKLFLGTSFGWVSAARAAGSWKGSGMSDITLGYKIANLTPKFTLAGTYRYAPVAVSGNADGHSYRGVWETHYLGSRASFAATPSINVLGSAELGYMVAHVHDVDGQTVKASADANGAQLAIGGGADFMLAEKWAFSGGPRLCVGFGSFTTMQLAAAAGFMF